MNGNRIFFIIVLLGVFLNSCKDEYNICNQSRNVFLQSMFYTQDAGMDIPYSPPLLSLRLINNSQYIYNHVAGLSSFTIPLNPAKDSSVYLIQPGAGAAIDTLTLVYNTYNLELSPACGTINCHTIIRAYATHHAIDSIAIADPSVTNSVLENIKIYY